MEAELHFVTATIIPRKNGFVKYFFEKIIKKSQIRRIPLLRKDFSSYLNSLRHLELYKSNKNNYDKWAKNLLPIFLHKKNDKKSYKMDIYKIDEVVYNIVPDKDTEPRRLLIPAQLVGF